jgi:hypothetical protein
MVTGWFMAKSQKHRQSGLSKKRAISIVEEPKIRLAIAQIGAVRAIFAQFRNGSFGRLSIFGKSRLSRCQSLIPSLSSPLFALNSHLPPFHTGGTWALALRWPIG